ncbi:MAG: undecaprenyl-diphosphate phosphatase [Phycisphaerales bacterium]|nr:undecaprenyl-diphosphate phosphatase [Phycisphaerales bacterium]
MLDAIRAVILGIIEGLTEFLPVSSTGHMVIAMPLLGIRATDTPWRVLLWVSQFGAILAVITLFFDDLRRELLHRPRGAWRSHLLAKLAAAMVPTIVLALLFHDRLEPLEDSPAAVAVALIVGAVVMEVIDRTCRRSGQMTIHDVTLKQAIWIGAIQAISMIPGVSRAGATIMGGMALGLTPRIATVFSFYLAIPTMLAATAKTLKDDHVALSSHDWGVVLVGTGVSYVVALLVVAGFLEYVKRYRFTVFNVYRVLLGTAVLIWHFAR